MILEYRSTHFEEFDSLLGTASNGPSWLNEEAIAQVAADAIRFRDEKTYELLCYCIMPNHVHLIIKDIERRGAPLYKVMQSLKSYTGAAIKSPASSRRHILARGKLRPCYSHRRRT